jgi:hypothetical protein
MASKNPTGYLTLRAGTFGRTTHVTKGGATREISISFCPVFHWRVNGGLDNKLNGRSFNSNERFEIAIMEGEPGEVFWPEDPEKIGALNADLMHANIFMPPDAFGHFWAVAEATDGSTRHIELALKADHPDTFKIEKMPAPPEGNTSGRLHPVVAELRVMREKAKSIVVGFAVVLIAWILLTIFRHF